MKRLPVFALSTLGVLFLTTACAGGPPPKPVPIGQKLDVRGYTIGPPIRQLKHYRINGWNSVDRYHVIIHVGVNQDYLVTVRNPCEGFRTAVVLRFSTTVGNMTNMDKLVVRGAGGFVEQCFIQSIHVLNKTKKPGRHR